MDRIDRSYITGNSSEIGGSEMSGMGMMIPWLDPTSHPPFLYREQVDRWR